MAGGKGTRFWPLSREKKAKQFLTMVGDKPMIAATFDRVVGLTKKEHRWILGNHIQSEQLDQFTNYVNPNQILREPFGKNTAACIGWAAFEALKKDPDAVCVMLSADAWIEPISAFQTVLQQAVAEVQQTDSVVTIGIPPTRPHTGYGYIEVAQSSPGCVPIKSFVEKPDLATAQQYLKSDQFFWNAGIFVWSAKKIIDCLKRYMPHHYSVIKSFTDQHLLDPAQIAPYYEQLEPISIDYGVMEHISDQIKLIPATFSWSDIGSWGSLEEYLPKDSQNNAIKGNVLAVKSQGNIVVSDKRLVALGYVDDLIVIDSDDALLILPKDQDQAIKSIYEQLDQQYK